MSAMPNSPTDFSLSFEEIACDNCGSNQSQFMFQGPDRLYGLPGLFTLVRCRDCGWIRQNPRLTKTELNGYYPVNYVPYAKAIDDEANLLRRLSRRYGILKRCRSVESFAPKGRLLEVGCGTGNFLNEMHRRGWPVVGIEPNKYASHYVRDRFGLDVFTGTLEEFDPQPESFDVICAWDVVEHVPEPAKDILRMRHALKRNGLLVLSMPNLASFDRILFGEAWLGWDLPRHLYLFPNKLFDRFIESNGMQIIDRQGVPGSYDHFLASLRLFLNDRFATKMHLINWIIPLFQQFPVRIGVAPLFWLINLSRLSTLIAVYIRRN
jgi:2-polyprenyl-3-methyl-5-hydroxy-6-metoxy-1,4-benzoquinol methylase